MEAEESLAESDGGSYFNQSETWPEEVQEVNVKNANSKLVFMLTSKLSAKWEPLCLKKKYGNILSIIFILMLTFPKYP